MGIEAHNINQWSGEQPPAPLEQIGWLPDPGTGTLTYRVPLQDEHRVYASLAEGEYHAPGVATLAGLLGEHVPHLSGDQRSATMQATQLLI